MKQTFLFLLLLLLLPFGAGASPLPYTTGGTGVDTFWLVYNQQKTSVQRIEFFKETERNLGLSEAQLKKAIEQGHVRIVPCKNCDLETAGLVDGKSVYWRNVKEGEPVAHLLIEGVWRPWFLVSCGNPVRPIPLLVTKRQEVAQVFVPVTPPVTEICVCCEQGTPQHQSRVFTVYVHESFLFDRTRVYTTYGHGTYFPTRCVTDRDYSEFNRRERK